MSRDMNYYPHHIGDYRRDTSHLSLLEHGVYRQLIDTYYLSEQPIPKETEVVFRRLSARTDEEKKAVEIVLSEFFSLTDEGWIQTRCHEEIREYQGKANRARDNGKLGGRPKKTNEVIYGLSKETEEKANQEPITINHKPITNLKHKPLVADATNTCPFEDIKNLYHECMPNNPRILKLDETRKINIRARWEECAKGIGKLFGYKTVEEGLACWRNIFETCADSKFLTGQVPGVDGKKPFAADIDFIFNKTRFLRIIENKYHERLA
jgi:uncharacterized protein YdaU (DUF1376 family)